LTPGSVINKLDKLQPEILQSLAFFVGKWNLQISDNGRDDPTFDPPTEIVVVVGLALNVDANVFSPHCFQSREEHNNTLFR
jgi:hypothetical protein